MFFLNHKTIDPSDKGSTSSSFSDLFFFPLLNSVWIGIKNLLFVLTSRSTKGHLFKVWSDCQYCAFKRAWHLCRESSPTISFPICALHFIHSGLMSCSCNLICTDSPPCDIWASSKTLNHNQNLRMKGLIAALAWIWPLNLLSVILPHFFFFSFSFFSVHAQISLLLRI